MKHSILSITLLVLMISLTITITVVSTELNLAFAIEDYLQLRSASINMDGRIIDVDIRSTGNIQSEKDKTGFGYAVLTDVGNEDVNNAFVVTNDIGIRKYDSSTRNDKLHTHVLDLTGEISKACSGSDYEIDKSSSDNKAFDTNYSINVKGNKISLDNIDTDDLASDTVKAIASFTAEAITHNGKITHICIDIQDVLKQSEITTDFVKKNDDDNNNGNEDKDDDDNVENNRNIYEDNDKDNDEVDYEETKNGDSDGLFKIDIGQIVGQNNNCNDEDDCHNKIGNIADILGFFDSGDDDNLGINLNLDQIIGQNNECNDEDDCRNEGESEVNAYGGDYPSFPDVSDLNSNVNIHQSIEQSNICNGGSECNNYASSIANIS